MTMSAMDRDPTLVPNFSGLTLDGVTESTSEAGLPPCTFQWKLITDQFMQACQDLTLGELLHDDLFGLFEAMSAIEMMDPKMDAGMQCNRIRSRRPAENESGNLDEEAEGSSHLPLSFAVAKGTKHLPMEDLSPEDFISIIDMTFCCLVTWLEGHSLAQTVFTNLYLHQPLEVTHQGLSSFCVVILKLVELIRDIISKGGVYEDEDFQPLTYGFKLCEEVSEQKASSSLKEVEDELQKVLRSTRPKADEERNSDTIRRHELTAALFSRLRFSRLLYQCFAALSRHELTESKKFLISAKEQLSKLSTTTDLGNQSLDVRCVVGFEPWANQRLLPPSFPRYTEIRSSASTMDYLACLLDRLFSVLDIAGTASFHMAIDSFQEFGSSSSCVLSRSVLQLLYLPLHPYPHALGDSSPSSLMRDLLKEACKAFIAPAVLTTKVLPLKAKEIRDCVDNFFMQCCRPMKQFINMCGHNRARQRDRIPALLEEFAIVQEEADKLDTMLNAILPLSGNNAAAGSPLALRASASQPPGTLSHVLPFTTWLLYHVLKLMVRYILSGFELELFSAHEYPYLYWYLHELLYPCLITCLHRADTHLAEHERVQELAKNITKKKKKAGGKSSKKKARPFAREISCYQGYATLCTGYFKLMLALKKEQKVLVPTSGFDNEFIRYERRFSPFRNLLTPPFMPHAQYMEVYEHTIKSEAHVLYLSASQDFTQARQIFEIVMDHSETTAGAVGTGNSLSEMSTLATVAKSNLVASSVLATVSNRKVEIDFSVHNAFPTLKFV